MDALDLSTVSSGPNYIEYAVCIRQSDCHPFPDPLSWAWYHPSFEDFEPLPHTAFLVGQLKRDKAVVIASLRNIAGAHYNEWRKTHGDMKDIVSRLLKGLNHNLMIILNHPLAFRDVVVFVAEAQQYFLDIMAFLDYVLDVQPHIAYPSFVPPPVHPQWMGCFTTDTKVCDELFHTGVPVWLVRHNFSITPRTIIEKPVRFTFPDEIICSMYCEGAKPTRPFICLYLVVFIVTSTPGTTIQLRFNPASLFLKHPPLRCKLLVKWVKCLLKRKHGEPCKRSAQNLIQVSGP
jgi:hypothetical protein